MARIEIKSPEGSNGRIPSFLALKVLVDGREIRDLTGIELDFNINDAPRARISILVNEVEIDATALVSLQAQVTAQNERRGS